MYDTFILKKGAGILEYQPKPHKRPHYFLSAAPLLPKNTSHCTSFFGRSLLYPKSLFQLPLHQEQLSSSWLFHHNSWARTVCQKSVQISPLSNNFTILTHLSAMTHFLFLMLVANWFVYLLRTFMLCQHSKLAFPTIPLPVAVSMGRKLIGIRKT